LHTELPSRPSDYDEDARLRVLDEYGLLEGQSNAAFDRLVGLTSRIFEVPVASITLVQRDRVAFAAKVGIEALAAPRETSFCTHAIDGQNVMVVPDATKDVRFAANPMVVDEPKMRFYAGAPLVSYSGHVLGTLCIIDFKPRPEFGDRERDMLKVVADLTMQQMEIDRLRKVESGAQKVQQALQLSERQFHLLVNGVTDYALYMISPSGIITSWNSGAQRIKGYAPDEVIGQNFSKFFTEEDRLAGLPSKSLRTAAREGRSEANGWRVRKDGSLFWANVIIDPIYEDDGRLIGFAKITRDITGRRQYEDQLLRLAHFDPLTELPNRFSLRDKLEEELKSTSAVTVLIMDLGGFKDTNDLLGHPAGDFLLKAAAERIASIVADGGVISRFGGDEFAIILPGVANPLVVAEICQRLIGAFREPFRWEEQEVFLALCIGIAMSPSHGSTADELLTSADLALCQAKSEGQYGYYLFQPALRQVSIARATRERELRQAAENDEFELYYQPQVRLADRRMIGAEALLRWRHPERGLIAPGAFMDVLARTAFAPVVGDWVLRSACEFAATVRRQALPDFRVAVNLFGSQFRRGQLVSTVLSALKDNQLAPAALQLEITEKMVLRQEEIVTGPLRELREMGVHAAFDDFGTGHASLSLLKQFPLNELKIDKGFVREMCSSAEDAAVVRAILDLAGSFGLSVVAEGIENEDQEAALIALGCEVGQGFLYGRPMAAQALLNVIDSQIEMAAPATEQRMVSRWR